MPTYGTFPSKAQVSRGPNLAFQQPGVQKRLLSLVRWFTPHNCAADARHLAQIMRLLDSTQHEPNHLRHTVQMFCYK